MSAITQVEIDQQVFDLYDEYCHGRIDRREFLRRAGALGAAALPWRTGCCPNYARAQTISFTDIAHQGELRHVSVARRQRRQDARLPGAAGGATGRGRRCW